MSEMWRVVADTDGYYEVSNLGRVRSWCRRGRHVYLGRRTTPPVILKFGTEKNGRAHVNVRMGGRLRTRQVAELVAAAFIGPKPAGLEICHNDGDPANNHVSNLRYDTHSGNLADRIQHGTMTRGSQHGRSVLTEDQVRAIRREYAAGGIFHAQLATRYRVSPATVGMLIQRKTWAWLS